jgi:YHS domain-containing protein
MQVRTATAPARIAQKGRRHWFCSDHCADRFRRDPNRYRRHRTTPEPAQLLEEELATATDPVCRMTVDPATAGAIRAHEGRRYFFCATGCAEAFETDPDQFLETSGLGRAGSGVQPACLSGREQSIGNRVG